MIFFIITLFSRNFHTSFFSISLRRNYNFLLLQASDGPVSSSRWSLNRLHSSPNSSSYSDSAALFNSSPSATDADEQPPSKIRRFYGFVRRLVGFDGDS